MIKEIKIILGDIVIIGLILSFVFFIAFFFITEIGRLALQIISFGVIVLLVAIGVGLFMKDYWESVKERAKNG